MASDAGPSLLMIDFAGLPEDPQIAEEVIRVAMLSHASVFTDVRFPSKLIDAVVDAMLGIYESPGRYHYAAMTFRAVRKGRPVQLVTLASGSRAFERHCFRMLPEHPGAFKRVGLIHVKDIDFRVVLIFRRIPKISAPSKALVLSPELSRYAQFEKCCSHCHERCDVQRCAGCNVALYCGRECQKADWSRHKPVCASARATLGPGSARAVPVVVVRSPFAL